MISNKFGTDRVISPKGSLPQAASRVNNIPVISDNEILIEVSILNITATAFARIKRISGGDKNKMAEEVMSIVNDRGKFQCPETGSGGMLLGTVLEVGKDIVNRGDIAPGEKIATMVSLSLTPLYIEEIIDIRPDTDQVYVKGKAILFESGIYAKIPKDLSEAISVAVMDVAGAPAWTAKYVVAGDNVVVIGTGKAGILCLHEAKKRAGITGRVIAIEYSKERCELIRSLNIADEVVNVDATDPVATMNAVAVLTQGRMADFVVNTVSVANTEMSSILSAREHGTVLFFSMSTVFSKAALGCEGVGKVVTLLIGTGYTEGHAEITFQILRENPQLREYFEKIYE